LGGEDEGRRKQAGRSQPLIDITTKEKGRKKGRGFGQEKSMERETPQSSNATPKPGWKTKVTPKKGSLA